VLYDSKFREHLIASRHLEVGIDADEETTFAIDKSNHPLGIKLHRQEPNVKSLRVLIVISLPCGLSPCPSDYYCSSKRMNEY
jgi:hypothetical protein